LFGIGRKPPFDEIGAFKRKIENVAFFLATEASPILVGGEINGDASEKCGFPGARRRNPAGCFAASNQALHDPRFCY
jgi:hypothetical protein